jgi:hypothetical protein
VHRFRLRQQSDASSHLYERTALDHVSDIARAKVSN